MSPSQNHDALSATADGVAVKIKVVPNASRTKIAGQLGDRIKLAVAAPPEAGKANKAVRRLLADLFDLPLGEVRITAGLSQPRKTVELLGISLCEAANRFGKK
jgi:uncharacterized protein (TIGR00251 family)